MQQAHSLLFEEFMNVGQAIKMCRTRRGLSLTELARRTQCSISYLSMLEKSQRDPTLSMIEKISLSMNVPVSILFFLAADKNEIAGIDKDLAGQLAMTALDFINEPDVQPTLL